MLHYFFFLCVGHGKYSGLAVQTLLMNLLGADNAVCWTISASRSHFRLFRLQALLRLATITADQNALTKLCVCRATQFATVHFANDLASCTSLGWDPLAV